MEEALRDPVAALGIGILLGVLFTSIVIYFGALYLDRDPDNR
jgi:hypothetical protein